MKFLVSWSLPSATFRPAVARFLKAGGMPPCGRQARRPVARDER